MEAFYAEVDSISDSLRAFDGIVSRIGQLRDRSFNATEESARSLDHDIEQLEKDARNSINSLKSRIQALRVQGGSTTDAKTRRDHIQRLRERLRQSLSAYQQVESEYRKRVRGRMERQLRIVKPDATEQEVEIALDQNDGQGDQIFKQALLNTPLHGQAALAYQEVRSRQTDLQRIEQTMAEVAQLINDIAVLVEKEDEDIEKIVTNAADTEKYTGMAVKEINKTIENKKKWRKRQQRCFIILAVVIILVLVAVGLYLAHHFGKI